VQGDEAGSSGRSSAGELLPCGAPLTGAGVVPAEPVPRVAAAVAAAACAGSLQGAGSVLVEGIAGALDLESVYLYVIEDDGDAACLRLLAHKGEHSAFMADTPTITLDADLPVVRALLLGRADYDSDPHGLGEPLEGAPGVGRWRAAIGAQAEATLPLLAQGHAVGSLAMSWHSPRTFSDTDRRELERIASAAALVLDGFANGAPSGRSEGTRETATVSFVVDGEGRVAEGTDDPAAVLSIAAATACTCEDGYAAFCEVCACSDGRTAIALGVVGASDGSAATHAVEAKRLLCGWMGHGLEPAAALDALAAWISRDEDPARRICAIACIVDTTRRCVTYATTHHALAAVLSEEGRFMFDASDAGDASPAGPATERAAVLLSGDRLALWSGDASGLAADGGPEFARLSLAGSPAAAGSPAVALLRERGAGGCSGEVAVVVDVGRARPVPRS
jgi:hypothetical protein